MSLMRYSLTNTLRTDRWGSDQPLHEHARHNYHGQCGVCRGDVDAIVNSLLPCVESALAKLRRVANKTYRQECAERARAEQAEFVVQRVRDLIDSYPPGSDFARSGAQALFRRTLDQTEET